MRIVGGRLRGRVLAAPPSRATRPTSDRVREAIFNVLAHAYDDPVPGARVLDLFAGTGAMGLEALSRGATYALFVDDSAASRAVIRRNAEALGLGGATRLFRRDATRLGAIGPFAPFSLVFCDPPYRQDLAAPALRSAAEGGWLAEGAIVVLEERDGPDIALPDGFETCERRVYGETRIVLAHHAGAASAAVTPR